MAAETIDWEKLRSRARYLEAELERALPDLVSLVKAGSSASEEARLTSMGSFVMGGAARQQRDGTHAQTHPTASSHRNKGMVIMRGCL